MSDRYQTPDGKRQFRHDGRGWLVRYRNYYGRGWGKWIPYAGIGEPPELPRCSKIT